MRGHCSYLNDFFMAVARTLLAIIPMRQLWRQENMTEENSIVRSAFLIEEGEAKETFGEGSHPLVAELMRHLTLCLLYENKAHPANTESMGNLTL